jgi:nicotinamidase-related amidase
MKTVFFDIDTQIDFVYPAGALYVPGAEHILPVIGELNRRAPLVISTMDAHARTIPSSRFIRIIAWSVPRASTSPRLHADKRATGTEDD